MGIQMCKDPAVWEQRYMGWCVCPAVGGSSCAGIQVRRGSASLRSSCAGNPTMRVSRCEVGWGPSCAGSGPGPGGGPNTPMCWCPPESPPPTGGAAWDPPPLGAPGGGVDPHKSTHTSLHPLLLESPLSWGTWGGLCHQPPLHPHPRWDVSGCRWWGGPAAGGPHNRMKQPPPEPPALRQGDGHSAAHPGHGGLGNWASCPR